MEEISGQNQEPVSNGSRPELLANKVITKVAEFYNLSESEVRGEGAMGSQLLNTVRHQGMYLVANIAGLGPSAIGRLFGNRINATVGSAIRKIGSFIEKDPTYLDDLKTFIECELGSEQQ